MSNTVPCRERRKSGHENSAGRQKRAKSHGDDYILFHTGIRISEFCGLTVKDIDLEKKILNIDHQLQRIPCLTVPAEKEKPIGIWGQRHLRYIKKEHNTLYTELLTSGRLNAYLADINEQAMEQMLLLTKQMAEREGVTEQLKAQDQMLWVQRMNNICDRAMEIVNHDLIYA